MDLDLDLGGPKTCRSGYPALLKYLVKTGILRGKRKAGSKLMPQVANRNKYAGKNE
jgi:hypothetical protein